MSSTNRGGQRTESDNYPTPSWVVHRLLDRKVLPQEGAWYEPCAGEGAIIQAVQQRFSVDWYATELRSEAEPFLEKLLPSDRINIGDFLVPSSGDPSWRGCGDGVRVVITNPPYRIAFEVLHSALSWYPKAHVAILLRLNFIASERRHATMAKHPPDVYVLPNRPAFKEWGSTDSPEYSWFVYPPAPRRRNSGRISVLGLTSLEERKRCSSREP
jgi:hypothetical protein